MSTIKLIQLTIPKGAVKALVIQLEGRPKYLRAPLILWAIQNLHVAMELGGGGGCLRLSGGLGNSSHAMLLRDWREHQSSEGAFGTCGESGALKTGTCPKRQEDASDMEGHLASFIWRAASTHGGCPVWPDSENWVGMQA